MKHTKEAEDDEGGDAAVIKYHFNNKYNIKDLKILAQEVFS